MSVLVAVNQPQIEISVNEFENFNFIKLNFNFMRNDIEIFLSNLIFRLVGLQENLPKATQEELNIKLVMKKIEKFSNVRTICIYFLGPEGL